ncbi:MAG: ergothioneine biosynthesis protein EgtB [Lautropia sp.]
MIARYRTVRARSLALAAPLSPEDCQAQSMPDASPVKWHLAHTTWFFETFVLARFAPDYRPAEPSYRMLFNSYYNAVGDRHPRPERGLLTRPALADVVAYRGAVDAAVERLLTGAAGLPEGCAALLELGLQHEQQHQELIVTDVKHLLSCNPLGPAYRDDGRFPDLPESPAARPAATAAAAGHAIEPAIGPASRRAAGGTARRQGWHRSDGGIVEIGHGGAGFAFDNESPRHPTLLAPYALADRLVDCADYLRFIADGGYRRPELWLSLGWDRVRAEYWEAPFYWRRIGTTAAADAAGWQQFTLAGWQPLDPAAPVAHLSYFEADAYARWADARLPTEAEWEHLAASLDWGTLWEWTASSYAAYPGFRASRDAIGEYNGKFMCNQYVLRGASFATPASHRRVSYRNFFPPEARWQFTGLRLAREA